MTYALPQSLAELEARLAQDLLWLNRPARPWVEARHADGAEVLDVAVVGAGLNGLIALAALGMHGIYRVRAFDRAPAGREGPWVTYARMDTLRTAKELPGLALGMPALTFRAWYEARFGRAAFEAMGLIPTAQWMDYLVWYRKVLGLDVVNEAEVTAVAHRDDGLFELTYRQGDAAHVAFSRRLVIASGLDGLGAPVVPAVAQRIDPRYRAHGADAIDMQALQGRRVAVVGSGSSAMDNAASALEAGAARVDIFVRRETLAKIDKLAGIGGLGTRHGYFDLPDADKWEIMSEAAKATTPPPRHSVLRVSAWPNAHFHLSSPVLDLVERGGAIELVTPKGRYCADFIIFATGFGIDFSQRPEFSAITERALLWGEAYRPPPDRANPALALSPYLGPAFEFTPRPGNPDHAWLSHAYCFSFPSLLSHGKINSGIPSVNEGAATLANGIARSLFREDRGALLEKFHAYAGSELTGDEWTDADAISPIQSIGSRS